MKTKAAMGTAVKKAKSGMTMTAKKKVDAKKPTKKMMYGGDMKMPMAKKGASVKKKEMAKCKMGC